MSEISKRKRHNASFTMRRVTADHGKFLNRITKTLYYGKLPPTERFSMPMSELAVELFSEAHRGHTLQRLQMNSACNISRNALVSPCALVLAMLYLDRLRDCNPEYVRRVAPSELFLVSLMVSSKFLHDDGSEDEVFLDEWAISGGITVAALKQLERDFLDAMDWKIFISKTTFWTEFEILEQTLALREATRRGWFSYSELSILLPSPELAKMICCATGILTMSYIASLIVLVGAVFITSQIPGNALNSHTESRLVDTDITQLNVIEGRLKEFDFNNTHVDVINLLECNDTSVQLHSKEFPSNQNFSDIWQIYSIWFKYRNLVECLDLRNQNNFTLNNGAVWYSLIF